jgi:hypothetical protein
VTQELMPIAKFASDTATAIGGAMPDPLKDAFGNTLAEFWQGIFGDRIAAWRVANAAKTHVRLTSKLTAMGIKLDTSKIPERYAYAWFDEASKQDEPEIQDLFAAVLAQAVTGNEDALQRRNIELISKLSPRDALLFSHILEICLTRTRVLSRGNLEFSEREDVLLHIFERDYDFSDKISYENLQNIGVLPVRQVSKIESGHLRKIVESSPISWTSSWDEKQAIATHNVVILSQTGVSLLWALYPERLKTEESN